MPNNEEFFAVMSEQSEIKTKIVTDYFSAWSNIIKRWSGNMGYIDLFCGPGVYDNDKESSPIIIIKRVLDDPILLSKIRFYFNDADEKAVLQLRKRICELDYRGRLSDKLQYSSEKIGIDFNQRITIPEKIPILSFVDPFGYKGLTMQLLDKLIANQGSDCIFFFNYNRINMAISNSKFDEHLEGLFGKERTESLKSRLKTYNPSERETIVRNELINALLENKSNYVLPFKFYSAEKLRTSHFIVFITKHPSACKIMKRIMYQHSTKDADGVANFSYEDSHNFLQGIEQLSLFNRPLQELKDSLVNEHHGNCKKVQELCDYYNMNIMSPFVGENVKEALKQLETSGQIEVVSGRLRKTNNGKLNMPDGAIVRFL